MGLLPARSVPGRQLRCPPGRPERPQHPLRLRRVEPPLRIALEEPPYDGQERRGLCRRPYLVHHDGVQDAAQRVAPERRFAAQCRTEERAQRPQVGLRARSDAGHPFGRGVLGRADEGAGLGERGGARDLGDTEVGEDDPVGAVLEKHVRGLDVPVQHPGGMGRAEGAQQGDADPGGLVGVDGAVLGDAVGERAAVDQLHDDVRAFVVLDNIVHDDDVRVAQLGDRARLTQGAVPP